jgi:26S proteasome non-ATPase regulatory subunit 9
MKQIEIALNDLHSAMKSHKSLQQTNEKGNEMKKEEIIVKSNDNSSNKIQVEKAVETSADEKEESLCASDFSSSALSSPLEPFYLVDEIFDHSPAQLADLRLNDQIISFGTVNCTNFSNQAMAEVTRASVGRGITVKVKRENATVELVLIPQRWSGQGLLGCHLTPLYKNNAA